MTRVEEIAAAFKSKPTLMFLIGIAALGQRDFDGIYRDMKEAAGQVYSKAEALTDEKYEAIMGAFLEKMKRGGNNGR